MSRRGVPRVIVEILEGYRDDISRDVVMGIAEELWVHAYSTWGKGDKPGPDQDWYDVLGESPPAAFQAADVIGKSIEALNHLPIGEIAWEARGYVTSAHGACTVPNRSTGDFAQGVGRALARECMGGGNLLGFPHKVMSSFAVSFDGQYLEWTPREPEKTGGRDLALATNPSNRTWFVVRVDRDDRDTYAGKTLDEAIELANADHGSVLEYGTVDASDGGAARIMRPARWTRVEEGPHMNPSGLTKKGERMYKAVERGYRAAGDARAKEIAARTVFASAKHGTRGLIRNPDGTIAVGELVVTPDDEVGRVVALDGNDAQVIHEDRIEGRGPWYWGIGQLLEPHEDAKREYLEAAARVGRKNPSGGAVSKPGKHGTLHRFAVTYSPGPGSVPLLWYTWAYDQEHALERFYGSDDGDWEVISVGRVTR